MDHINKQLKEKAEARQRLVDAHNTGDKEAERKEGQRLGRVDLWR